MALLKQLEIKRVGNFLEREYKCMNCGKPILGGGGNNIYSKRFCSENCKTDYLL